jgi:hypothetical protein
LTLIRTPDQGLFGPEGGAILRIKSAFANEQATVFGPKGGRGGVGKTSLCPPLPPLQGQDPGLGGVRTIIKVRPSVCSGVTQHRI